MSDTNKITMHIQDTDSTTSFDATGLYALNIGAKINDGIAFLIKKKINDFYGNGSKWDDDLINQDEMQWVMQLSMTDILDFSRDYEGQTLEIYRNVFDTNGENYAINLTIKHGDI